MTCQSDRLAERSAAIDCSRLEEFLGLEVVRGGGLLDARPLFQLDGEEELRRA